MGLNSWAAYKALALSEGFPAVKRKIIVFLV